MSAVLNRTQLQRLSSGTLASVQRRWGTLSATLDRYTKQGRYVGPYPSSNYAPKVFADDQTCGINKDDLTKAMNTLLASGRIKIVQEGRTGREVSKLVRAI